MHINAACLIIMMSTMTKSKGLPRTISIRLGNDEIGKMINEGLQEMRNLEAYQTVKADAMLVTMLLNEIIRVKLAAHKNAKP